MAKINIFWFRRDLRLEDNSGLFHALNSQLPVLPLFIFDSEILDKLENRKDARVEFIHNALTELNDKLYEAGTNLLVKRGSPLKVWKELMAEHDIGEVFTNSDYEPYAVERDSAVKELLAGKQIAFNTYKDHVIFEKNEVLKQDRSPYTIYTPYSKVWRAQLNEASTREFRSEKLIGNFAKVKRSGLPSLESIGFKPAGIEFPPKELPVNVIKNYDTTRDIPAINGTSRLSVHLRFGTVSIRKLVREALKLNDTWLRELIWREFFMMILYRFPHSATGAFRKEYDNIKWRNNEAEFEAWCRGETGYPIVDAGMRELNATGFMHNRLRMITASFLTKDLLIDWRWGERYFAEKLLDYELASNCGGWQWAAGTGCDAAPYFRIFNPDLQAAKFDPEHKYIKKWVPELEGFGYPQKIVDHSEARNRTLAAYKNALSTVKKT
ncbi:MAG: deoxyribodipyrimidine photo-lyase [Ignavibacteria bacterium]|nr:deoxyribodipyrimidine photo-lyase [Ignavibacteria bacterium]